MAVENQKVRVVHPDFPEQALKAYLIREDGSSVSLRFEDIPEPRPTWITELRIPRLLVVWPEPATLFHSLSRAGMFASISPEIVVEAPVALLGGHFERNAASFDTMTLEADGCATWFGINGFQDFRSISLSPSRVALEYETPDPLTWELGNGWTFIYEPRARRTLKKHPNWSLSIVEHPSFTIKGPELLSEDGLLRAMSKAIAFVEFATDERLTFESVYLADSANPSQNIEFAAEWKRDDRQTRRMDFWVVPYRDVRENFGEHLATWFALYDKLPLALDLYRVCKERSGPPAELRFFAIISALESLHRSVIFGCPRLSSARPQPAGNLTLENRLRDLVCRYGEFIGDLLAEADCKRVADTRNFLAHQTPTLALRAIPTPELFGWFRRLAMVFEICILAQLPFRDAEAFKRNVARRWNHIQSGALGEWNFA